MKNVAILLSGRGSNFIALAEAIKQKQISAEIVAVISNRSNATGLNYARTKGYPTWLIPSRGKSLTTELHRDSSLLASPRSLIQRGSGSTYSKHRHSSAKLESLEVHFLRYGSICL